MRDIRTALTQGATPVLDEEISETTRRISEHLVRLVQILFGVVVAQSLVLYRGVITSPLHHDTIAAALALLSVYVMIVWSWIDWNTTMELRPYDFRRRPETLAGRVVEHTERFRLYADLAIVTLYAYVLFQVAPLVKEPTADLRYLLLGYPLIFVLYLVSGVFRIVRHGREASNVPPILWHLAAFLAILGVYVVLHGTSVSLFWLNCITLTLTVVEMRLYRWHRRRFSESRK